MRVACVWPDRTSEQQPSDIANTLYVVNHETCGNRPVDDAMVVGEIKWTHQARFKVLAVPHGFHLRACYTEDGDLRRIDDRCEAGTTDTPQTGDGHRSALHFAGLQFFVACA